MSLKRPFAVHWVEAHAIVDYRENQFAGVYFPRYGDFGRFSVKYRISGKLPYDGEYCVRRRILEESARNGEVDFDRGVAVDLVEGFSDRG